MTDEFDGQGGSYVLDKRTGRRRLQERTAVPEPVAPAPAVSPETPPAPEPSPPTDK